VHDKNPAVAKVGLTILVVSDLEGHPRSMIFISSERAYATSYQWFIVINSTPYLAPFSHNTSVIDGRMTTRTKSRPSKLAD